MWNTNRANSERRALRGQAAAESNAQTKAASARREERFTSSAVNTRGFHESQSGGTHTLVQALKTNVLPESHLAAKTEKRPHGLRCHKLRK